MEAPTSSDQALGTAAAAAGADAEELQPAPVAEHVAAPPPPAAVPLAPLSSSASAGAPLSTSRRIVFISLSAMLRCFRHIPPAVLQDSLFFFGSKRMWIFPSNDAETKESKEQPTDYLNLPAGFRELLLAKEARGEVCFLKPDVFGIPDYEVFGDYEKASAWLQRLSDPASGGAPYKALKLDPAWWEHHFTGSRLCPKSRWQSVVKNFAKGYHDYDAVQTLVEQSNPSLEAKLSW
jgi:hypothetical protein